MGFSRKRTGIGGRVRYAAMYGGLRGRQRSAGSCATRREADRAWQRAEVMLGLGRVGDPARGRQTFEHYVVETWFPNHQVEVTTRVRRGEAACTAWIRLPFTDNAPYAWLPQWAGHRMVIQGSPITRLFRLGNSRGHRSSGLMVRMGGHHQRVGQFYGACRFLCSRNPAGVSGTVANLCEL